ncbi:MAG TPA: methyltransferase domain-containing protein [Candidatus Sulfotelmatobacter sp.]|nr:methyltransferase domain-containing protein [Candidatus Sulfotelmatobacter sp.]
MTTIKPFLPQLLLLAGATAALLCAWAARNRPEGPASARPVSEPAFVLASFVSLFLELLLIRWISSEIRLFAYLKNFVLIACFLGFGYGASLSRRRVQMLTPLWGCLALAGITWYARRQPASLFVWVSEVMGEFEDVTMMGKTVWLTGADRAVSLALACATVAGAFLLVTLVFIPFGQIVGRALDASRDTIRAYSLNIAASLLGIWAFTALAFLSTPPWVWFLIGLLLCAGLVGGSRWALGFTLLAAALTAALLHMPATPSEWTIWSPYQKLRLLAAGRPGDVATVELETNGTWYQRALDLSERFIAAHPEQVAGKRLRLDPYNVPFLFQPRPARVLVVGAGMGNDVAGALRNGAGRVVAVEIDPQIFTEGRRLHPERPYSSPRVEAVVNDARNYFKHADRRFDLILFGLLDSHTLSSSFANIRLDNYVYTREAFAEAKRLLGEGGLVVVKFEVQREWLGRRMQEMLSAVFGRPPLVFRDEEGLGSRAVVFVAGDPGRIAAALAADGELAAFVREHAVAYPPTPVAMASDDWPFLYHQGRYIPTIYLVFSVLLAATAALFARRSLAGEMRGQWHFFFLGAAFLLLEVQVVSRLALFFGTTWIVNAVVLSAVLVMILLANLVASRWPAPGYVPCYAGLLASILLLYGLPLDRLFLPSELAKGLAVGGLFTLPLFFAGLIFITSFRAAPRKDAAFGANLLGAILGGFLESLAFLTGMRFLLLLAAALYLLSAAALIRRRPAAGPVDTLAAFR